MLEADLQMASLASAVIGKCENLLATPNRAGGFLLLFRVAVAGLVVPL